MNTNRKKIKLAGKKKSHREALIRSQVIELVRAGRIKTTPSKAKALKRVFDRLVTEGKKNTLASERRVRAFFGNNERSVVRFFDVVKEKLSDRNSGYTRVIKTLPRAGDNADQVYVMLVNTEVQEKKSKISKVLEKQSKKNEKKSEKVSKKDNKDTKVKSTKNLNVKDSSKGVRRVATS
ncbi:MAG: hypothetical protein KatS3mg085_024 [Candidatus Dojkabacteria bacterium]|nr:MAG: hypothetical protein KatS3mg085_024 [Candidatus Dojkabacteria bacterium]